MAVNSAPINRIYLADFLKVNYPITCSALSAALTAAGAEVAILPGTRDIWARDYMPVPTPGGLVQFCYAPDYLRPDLENTITDGRRVAMELGLPFRYNPLLVDGGNVVSGFGRVIMTDKVIRENPGIHPSDVRASLVSALEVDHIDFVPPAPKDFTGHADGLVHFLDERTVLVNDYRHDPKHPKYWEKLKDALRKAGFETVALPYNPFNPGQHKDSAVGIYLNFVDIGTAIIVPTYEMKEDEIALKCLQQLYPHKSIIGVDGREVAKEGGVFHCITWAATLLPSIPATLPKT